MLTACGLVVQIGTQIHIQAAGEHSGRSRGGSMVPQNPSFKGTFENTMPKTTTYTTFTLELRTLTSTVAIMHVCQLLYQDIDARMAYTSTYIYTTRNTWQP